MSLEGNDAESSLAAIHSTTTSKLGWKGHRPVKGLEARRSMLACIARKMVVSVENLIRVLNIRDISPYPHCFFCWDKQAQSRRHALSAGHLVHDRSKHVSSFASGDDNDIEIVTRASQAVMLSPSRDSLSSQTSIMVDTDAKLFGCWLKLFESSRGKRSYAPEEDEWALSYNRSVFSTKFWVLVVPTQYIAAGTPENYDKLTTPRLPPPKHFAALLTGIEAETEELNIRDTRFHGVCLLEWVYASLIDDSSSVNANACWRFMYPLAHPDFVPLLQAQHAAR